MTASSNLSVSRKAFQVTPSDSTLFAASARALYVGVGGNVTIVNPDGTTCLHVNVPQGSILPVECVRVNSTGTTASSIVGYI